MSYSIGSITDDCYEGTTCLVNKLGSMSIVGVNPLKWNRLDRQVIVLCYHLFFSFVVKTYVKYGYEIY